MVCLSVLYFVVSFLPGNNNSAAIRCTLRVRYTAIHQFYIRDYGRNRQIYVGSSVETRNYDRIRWFSSEKCVRPSRVCAFDFWTEDTFFSPAIRFTSRSHLVRTPCSYSNFSGVFLIPFSSSILRPYSPTHICQMWKFTGCSLCLQSYHLTAFFPLNLWAATWRINKNEHKNVHSHSPLTAVKFHYFGFFVRRHSTLCRSLSRDLCGAVRAVRTYNAVYWALSRAAMHSQ